MESAKLGAPLSSQLAMVQLEPHGVRHLPRPLQPLFFSATRPLENALRPVPLLRSRLRFRRLHTESMCCWVGRRLGDGLDEMMEDRE
jgi:hypothetical protein